MGVSFFAVSKCLKCTDSISKFHFKGFSWGKKVCLIQVRSDHAFIVGEDYLLELELIEIKSGVVHSRLLKYKIIKDLRINFF